MKSDLLKSNQSQLKSKYKDDPDSAIATLSAQGSVDFDNLAFTIQSPKFESQAGLHPFSGGDGTFECPVEIMLASWISCAGVTFAAVANSMHLSIDKCNITALGKMDFKGTLAVDRDAPIGITDLKLEFEVQSNETHEKLNKLIELTERYCVVHQTLRNPPIVTSKLKYAGPK